METDFNFTNSEKPPVLQLHNHGNAYLNAVASRLMIDQGGGWVEVTFDRLNQAICLRVVPISGISRYKLSERSGSHLHIGGRALDFGMKSGAYLHIGDNIFQHVENIKE